MNTLSGDELMEYLMDAAPFLKDGDWDGYARHFDGAEEAADINRCEHCGGYIVHCGNSSGVCADCAVVAWEGLGPDQHLNLTYERKISTRHRIHKYNRFVNFKDMLRRIQANNRCEMKVTQRQELSVLLKASNLPITPKLILVCLRKMGVLEKHRRHKERLAWEYGRWNAVTMLFDEYANMCIWFKRVMYAWDRLDHRRDRRKVFMNYAFVYDQICQLLHYTHLRVVPQLKSDKLYAKQVNYWARIYPELCNYDINNKMCV